MLVYVFMLFYGDVCIYVRLCSLVNKLENVVFLWIFNMNLLICKCILISKF